MNDNVRFVGNTCNLRMSKNCTLVQFSEPLTLKMYLLLLSNNEKDTFETLQMAKLISRKN